ncbi:MAG: helix-turn-helix domain-containing protein, partial [Actinomycetota bacterium]|nr:helix-turn-helix domain-containing protein [Actinomycetota bacterium]
MALLERRDRIVPREELYRLAWGAPLRDRDRSVDVYVHRLRSKRHRRGGGDSKGGELGRAKRSNRAPRDHSSSGLPPAGYRHVNPRRGSRMVRLVDLSPPGEHQREGAGR